MAGKRKRSRARGTGSASKRVKLSGGMRPNDEVVKKALLCQYYHEVMTLREYMLAKLPASSKIRRKKISLVGRTHQGVKNTEVVDEVFLAKYLDETLIGIFDASTPLKDERLKDWTCFSQRVDKTSSGIGDSIGGGIYCQSEVVDFAIWSLFMKGSKSGTRIQHLLCEGFRKYAGTHFVNNGANPTSSIPGILSAHPNHLVTAIKSPLWSQILGILGKEGERVMIDLLLDCGIFQSLESGRGNYFQLSGKPLSDLQVLKLPHPGISRKVVGQATRTTSVENPSMNTPGKIVFVRNRILYARAALNNTGGVRFGLRHIHVFNRYPYKPAPTVAQSTVVDDVMNDENRRKVLQIMMYIFPREFGLHNVFTSIVDSRETVQPLKDYTIREEEIRSKFSGKHRIKSVPKRLRGLAQDLVRKMQILHGRCSYIELLKHYCPLPDTMTLQLSVTESTKFESQAALSVQTGSKLASMLELPEVSSRKPSFMDHATPTANVSAFCRAVLSKVVPNEFLGTGKDQVHNKAVLMGNVHRFILMRRFESLSLHDVMQGLRLQDIPWLAPRNDVSAKMSQSDRQKRLELLNEFVYYLFDSILIPLIRTNFHVTESNSTASRLFYFRHDVWRSLSEPALASLKLTTFEELGVEKAQAILDSRELGFSHIRLLPKETGVRPIMNLKRRAATKGSRTTLSRSINSVLRPVFNMLTFEKKTHPHRLGSALFSVGDLYQNLKAFKSGLPKGGQLYFVKADVQAAFDTIPQSAVMRLMSSLPGKSEYRISKHMEVKPGGDGSKPIRRWTSLATSSDNVANFYENLEAELAIGKKNTVFVENVVGQFRSKDDMLALLAEHIQCSLVKIGKKFYRQKAGIPQGSVVSSLLCNYFYADLELHHLSFLDEDSLLLRLIDDFLLITTNQQHAKKFIRIMHGGVPEYGVTVNPDKTLTNFEVALNGMKLARLVGSCQFPYCGSFINTKTLNVTKNRERKGLIADSLTVEFSRVPGNTFHRKILSAFKIQAHAMFFDTTFNSLSTVLSNLYESFKETATKMWTYVNCLPQQKQPGARYIIRTITSLVELAAALLKSKRKNNEGYKCAVSKFQVEWLVLTAFRNVLRPRQSKYGGVIAWLENEIKTMKSRKAGDFTRLMGEKNLLGT